jgi:hypothetical protein
MHNIENQPDNRNRRSTLARIRRQAKRRGFRVLRDGCGSFSVIDTHVEPARPLLGLDHVPLWAVEQAISTPLPEPAPRRKRMARPVEPEPAAQARYSFLSLVDALKAQGGAP